MVARIAAVNVITRDAATARLESFGLSAGIDASGEFGDMRVTTPVR
jgi:hypothetical protein